MAGGTPTASISGNLSLAVPTGGNQVSTLNLLNGGNLNIQSSPGGDAGVYTRLFVGSNGDVGVNVTGTSGNLTNVFEVVDKYGIVTDGGTTAEKSGLGQPLPSMPWT